MLAIRDAAAATGSERLEGCDVYVTLEPCAMCAAAISFAPIRRLFFGASDPKMSAVENGARLFTLPTCHHRLKVYGEIGLSASERSSRRFSPLGAERVSYAHRRARSNHAHGHATVDH